MIKCPDCGNTKDNIKFGIKRLRYGDHQQYRCGKCRKIWYSKSKMTKRTEV